MAGVRQRVGQFVRDHQLISVLATLAVGAAGTLATVYGPDLVAQARTRATIRVDSSIDRCTTIEGTATVPGGRALWLFVRTPNGLYTPLQRVTADGAGGWNTVRTGIGDDKETGKEFTFYLVTLPDAWADYLGEIDKRKSLPTTVGLPPDTDILDTAAATRSGDQRPCPDQT